MHQTLTNCWLTGWGAPAIMHLQLQLIAKISPMEQPTFGSLPTVMKVLVVHASQCHKSYASICRMLPSCKFKFLFNRWINVNIWVFCKPCMLLLVYSILSDHKYPQCVSRFKWSNHIFPVSFFFFIFYFFYFLFFFNFKIFNSYMRSQTWIEILRMK